MHYKKAMIVIGDRVLLQLDDGVDKTKSGLYLPASVREKGITQPIIVRPVRGVADAYEIIAGERRWRAAQLAGQHQVPIVPIEATDGEALELAIIENVQRSDLNALEEAMGYQALIAEFRHSQDDIAKIVGTGAEEVRSAGLAFFPVFATFLGTGLGFVTGLPAFFGADTGFFFGALRAARFGSAVRAAPAAAFACSRSFCKRFSSLRSFFSIFLRLFSSFLLFLPFLPSVFFVDNTASSPPPQPGVARRGAARAPVSAWT
jgi:hypothetical protein